MRGRAGPARRGRSATTVSQVPPTSFFLISECSITSARRWPCCCSPMSRRQARPGSDRLGRGVFARGRTALAHLHRGQPRSAAGVHRPGHRPRRDGAAVLPRHRPSPALVAGRDRVPGHGDPGRHRRTDPPQRARPGAGHRRGSRPDLGAARQPLGYLFAFANCAGFMLYILLGHRIANTAVVAAPGDALPSGIDQLGLAMTIAAAVAAPSGSVPAAPAFTHPAWLVWHRRGRARRPSRR